MVLFGETQWRGQFMIRLKVTKVGNAHALIFTPEALALLQAGVGDSLQLQEVPDGYLVRRVGAPETAPSAHLARDPSLDK